MAEALAIRTPGGVALQGALHRPKRPSKAAVVLAPGRGYHMGMPLIRESARILAAAGLLTVRFNWRYFLTSGGEPSSDLSTEREDFSAVLNYVRGFPGIEKIVLAGKSLGSRVALDAACEEKDVAGLALLTLPLQSSLEVTSTAKKLSSVKAPMLVVNASDDPLCDLKVLYATLAASAQQPRAVIVPGNHMFEGANARETTTNIALAVNAIALWSKRWT